MNLTSLFLPLFLSLFLEVVIYLLILDKIKINDLITSSKYPNKYLELFYVSSNFEHTHPKFIPKFLLLLL